MKILGKLPYDKAFVEALVGMTPVIEHKKELEPLFREILENANLV